MGKDENVRPHLSVSQIANFARCPQKWYYSYKLRYQSKTAFKSQALSLGSAWDALMDFHFSDDLERKEDAIKCISENLDNVYEDSYVRWKVLRTFWEEHMRCVPMECQKEVLIKLDDKYDVLGYMDRHTFVDGDPVIIETKYSSRPENYLDVDNLEMQLGMYFLSDERIKVAKVEVVYNNTKMNPKKGESIEEFEKRFTREVYLNPEKYFKGWNGKDNFGFYVYRDELNLDMVVEQVYGVLDAIYKEAQWRNLDACVSGFGKCEFFEVCRNGLDIEKDKTLRLKEEK